MGDILTQDEIDGILLRKGTTERDIQRWMTVLTPAERETYQGRELSPKELAALKAAYEERGRDGKLTPIVSNYDFRHPARVNRDQLRTLENVHDNFGRLLSSSLSGMCRAVVDVELHRGRMTLADAAAFYREHAGMSEGAAASEAAKNSMFPGGAVMYLFGTDAIHDLRRKVSARQGSAFDLARFHDAFLSHGSVPVALVAESMLGHGAPGPGRGP